MNGATMSIYRTDKFHHSDEQYRLDAGNFTLLRLTLGRSSGKVKTATAGDARDKPAYRDRERVINAFNSALKVVCGKDVLVYVRLDGAGRKFGEVGGQGDRQDFLNLLEQVGLQMARNLGLEQLHEAVPAQRCIA